MDETRAEWEEAFPILLDDFVCRTCGLPAFTRPEGHKDHNYEWACRKCKVRTLSVYLYFGSNKPGMEELIGKTT